MDNEKRIVKRAKRDVFKNPLHYHSSLFYTHLFFFHYKMYMENISSSWIIVRLRLYIIIRRRKSFAVKKKSEKLNV